MEKVQWIVEGMTCSNCALTVNNYLQKQGAEQVKVNPITGEVSFGVELISRLIIWRLMDDLPFEIAETAHAMRRAFDRRADRTEAADHHGRPVADPLQRSRHVRDLLVDHSLFFSLPADKVRPTLLREGIGELDEIGKRL